MPSLQSTFNTNPPIGIVGQIADAASDGTNVAPMFITEATYGIVPYAHGVELDVKSGPGYDGTRERFQGVKLPNANNDKIFGLLMHSHATVDLATVAGQDGLLLGASANIMRRGRMICKPEASSGVVAGARLYVRAVAAGAEVRGALRGSADGTDCVDCSAQGEWLTEPDGDGLAILEVDFVAPSGTVINA